MTFKEHIAITMQERDAVAVENHKLRALLDMHGITYPGDDHVGQLQQQQQHQALHFGGPNNGFTPSATDSHSQPTTPGTFGSSGTTLPTQQQASHQQPLTTTLPTRPLPSEPTATAAPNYDQIGVNFVLASVPHSSSRRRRRGGALLAPTAGDA